MPMYKKYNFFNVMDILDEAKKLGTCDQLLKFDGDIHKVHILYDKTTEEFSVSINNVDIGSEFDFNEAYNMIRSCITADEGEL